jgi:putative transposase
MTEIYLLCNISRQGHHKAMLRLKTEYEKEIIFIRIMEQTREIHPGMGLRKIYDLTQPEDIGRDAFIALGLREGFRLVTIDNKVRTTYSVKSHRYTNLLIGKQFTDINQIWSSDITHFKNLEKDYYILEIMDVYSRRIIGHSLADNMRAENNFEALKMALNLRGIKNFNGTLIHHSDKGSQYASDLYTQTLEDYGIQISMCDDVLENSHVERLHQTIKNQYLYRMEITSEQELKQKAKEVIYTYNNLRPHDSLNGLTPVEYENLLPSIPMNKRQKLEIYTVKKNMEQKDPNQLNLMFDL